MRAGATPPVHLPGRRTRATRRRAARDVVVVAPRVDRAGLDYVAACGPRPALDQDDAEAVAHGAFAVEWPAGQDPVPAKLRVRACRLPAAVLGLDAPVPRSRLLSAASRWKPRLRAGGSAHQPHVARSLGQAARGGGPPPACQPPQQTAARAGDDHVRALAAAAQARALRARAGPRPHRRRHVDRRRGRRKRLQRRGRAALVVRRALVPPPRRRPDAAGRQRAAERRARADPIRAAAGCGLPDGRRQRLPPFAVGGAAGAAADAGGRARRAPSDVGQTNVVRAGRVRRHLPRQQHRG